jgi:hypothetical protein
VAAAAVLQRRPYGLAGPSANRPLHVAGLGRQGCPQGAAGRQQQHHFHHRYRTDNAREKFDMKYDDAVAEGKEIIAKLEAVERDQGDQQLRLGELAHKVDTKYREQTLAKFAKDIGTVKCTLERYRNVYRAWEGKLAPGPKSVSYAVLRELQKHPAREQIIRERPSLTKREAHEEMRKHNEGASKNKQKEKQNGKDQWRRDNEKWFRDLAKAANEAARVAGIVDPDDEEQLNKLLAAVEPNLLKRVRDAGELLVQVAERFAELRKKADEEEASAQACPKATSLAEAA